MSELEIRDRLIRLETIIGDDNRGVLAELKQLRQSVDDLKTFQIRVLSIFGALAVISQVILQILLK
jgi:hypothetical protein